MGTTAHVFAFTGTQSADAPAHYVSHKARASNRK